MLTLANDNPIIVQILASNGEFNCDLYKGLYDLDKTIVCHLLLTKLMDKQKDKEGFNLSWDNLYDKDKVVGVRYTVNNFSWLWYPKTEYYVGRYNQLSIIKFWEKN